MVTMIRHQGSQGMTLSLIVIDSMNFWAISGCFIDCMAGCREVSESWLELR